MSVHAALGLLVDVGGGSGNSVLVPMPGKGGKGNVHVGLAR